MRGVNDDLQLSSPGAAVDLERSASAQLSRREAAQEAGAIAAVGRRFVEKMAGKSAKPERQIIEEYEDIFTGIGAPSPPPPPDDKRDKRGKGGGRGKGPPSDVEEWSPEKKLLSGYMNWIFVIVVVGLVIGLMLYLANIAVDHWTMRNLIINSPEFGSVQDRMRALKDLSDLTDTRLQSFLAFALVSVGAFFLGLSKKFLKAK